MWPKCSYCRHKIRCELDGQHRQKAEEMYEILSEATRVSAWRDTLRRPSIADHMPWIKWQFVKEKRIWYDKHNKVVYCIVLKCQLNNMVKEHRI
jgi:hypothetical protein